MTTILKIAVLAIFFATTVVSCSKSNYEPSSCNKKENKEDVSSTSAQREGDIYGTGDDDREGGDKKKKSVNAK
jgi:hypothetical protein